MKRVWGHRGDWYGVDYTVGNDPVMKYAKVKIKGDTIESEVIQEVAKQLNMKVTDIQPHHIIRMDS